MSAKQFTADISGPDQSVELEVSLPDAESDLSDYEFHQQVDMAWQVCDRFDLQTDIWRGRILRVVRDREKRGGSADNEAQREKNNQTKSVAGGAGFLNWLKDRDVSKSQAYVLIDLANSADQMLEDGLIESKDVNRFSKRAFIETAQASPEVQQIVSEAARRGDQITRKEVKNLSDDWTAMNSDLIPQSVRDKAADNTIPSRYLAPLVKEMEKLPPSHQQTLKNEVDENPNVDTLKQVTAEAKYLSRYIEAAAQVQSLDPEQINLELALDEALRVGCLNSAADLVNQATQLEQSAVKLYTAWKRMNKLSDRVYVDSGESTPHLRALLGALAPLCSELIEVQLGEVDSATARRIRLRVLPDEMTGNGANSKVSTVAAHEVMVADTAANQPIDVPSEAI
ncbi:MAG: SAM dependent carboxyl methyltransferase [Phormidesmis priestleyi Ana]|uniref:SAM dependent carboxyl methyltransferase n=1 Tax=Phormidesmis priestleyi Ana TaxID=1666911 RepID=A0A0P7ZKH0_9CYAN|nr:MAG: SAM dependent carboxyl methyltransferase [Phormidesmis priestleyi Ana]